LFEQIIVFRFDFFFEVLKFGRIFGNMNRSVFVVT